MTNEQVIAILKADSALVDEALQGYLAAPGIPKALRDGMAYSLFAGGKRLRPVMALAACRLFGGGAEQAMPMACALEMIHTYSLIHDDLPAMDNDEFRRGKPTNHIVFGEGPAVLAGDGLLSYAMELMLTYACEHGHGHLVKAAWEVARGAGVFGMVAGQSLDLMAEQAKTMDENTLLSIHRGKTAAMLRASVLAGARCANAGHAGLAAMEAYGGQYGLLFQITDDILDVTGDQKSMGKTLGKDARDGKLTFVTLYGLEKAKAKAELAAKNAHAALEFLGEGADFFHGLIDYTITRQI